MYRATKDITLPTAITGSLPRPSWHTEKVGLRPSLKAMASRRFREQSEDVTAYGLRDQGPPALELLTDRDCRDDDDVRGQSWPPYPPNHKAGLDIAHPLPAPAR